MEYRIFDYFGYLPDKLTYVMTDKCYICLIKKYLPERDVEHFLLVNANKTVSLGTIIDTLEKYCNRVILCVLQHNNPADYIALLVETSINRIAWMIKPNYKNNVLFSLHFTGCKYYYFRGPCKIKIFKLNDNIKNNIIIN